MVAHGSGDVLTHGMEQDGTLTDFISGLHLTNDEIQKALSANLPASQTNQHPQMCTLNKPITIVWLLLVFPIMFDHKAAF